MSRFKKYIGYTHLWVGLFSGLCIFIVSLTGAILVFQAEIENTFSLVPDYGKIEKQDAPFLPPSVLTKKINAVYPQKKLIYIEYDGPERCAKGITFTEKERWGEILINPYSGALAHVPKQKEGWSFFDLITSGHTQLWIPDEWFGDFGLGGKVVEFTTLFFTLMLISGIILWWPKNKAASKQRFWFRWKLTTRWKRKNYDLHNIVGFYCSWIVIFMCLTGLVWSFEWFSNGAYWLMNGGKAAVQEQELYSNTTLISKVHLPIPAEDSLFIIAFKHPGNATRISIQMPENAKAGMQLIYDFDKDHKREVRTYDQYTLQPIKTNNPSELSWQQANAGEKMLRLNGEIHFGSIFGIASKIPVFLACLLAASLPVTGFYVWWGRRKKKKPAKKNPISKAAIV